MILGLEDMFKSDFFILKGLKMMWQFTHLLIRASEVIERNDKYYFYQIGNTWPAVKV